MFGNANSPTDTDQDLLFPTPSGQYCVYLNASRSGNVKPFVNTGITQASPAGRVLVEGKTYHLRFLQSAFRYLGAKGTRGSVMVILSPKVIKGSPRPEIFIKRFTVDSGSDWTTQSADITVPAGLGGEFDTSIVGDDTECVALVDNISLCPN